MLQVMPSRFPRLYACMKRTLEFCGSTWTTAQVSHKQTLAPDGLLEWFCLLTLLTAKHPKRFKCYCSMQACLNSASSLCQGRFRNKGSACFQSSSSACLQLLVPHAEEEEEDYKLWPANCVKCQGLFSVHTVLILLSYLLACNLIEACNTLSA